MRLLSLSFQDNALLSCIFDHKFINSRFIFKFEFFKNQYDWFLFFSPDFNFSVSQDDLFDFVIQDNNISDPCRLPYFQITFTGYKTGYIIPRTAE